MRIALIDKNNDLKSLGFVITDRMLSVYEIADLLGIDLNEEIEDQIPMYDLEQLEVIEIVDDEEKDLYSTLCKCPICGEIHITSTWYPIFFAGLVNENGIYVPEDGSKFNEKCEECQKYK